MCHISRRFPLVDLGAGRSLIIRECLGHSVVRCRHLATKPAPRGPLPPAGCFKTIKIARILQIYGQIKGLNRCIFANKYVFLEHKGTTAGHSPEPGRPLERLHGFPVLCIFFKPQTSNLKSLGPVPDLERGSRVYASMHTLKHAHSLVPEIWVKENVVLLCSTHRPLLLKLP